MEFISYSSEETDGSIHEAMGVHEFGHNSICKRGGPTPKNATI
jgi:hypothetical protein